MPPSCPNEELVKYRLDEAGKRLEKIEDRQGSFASSEDVSKINERVDILADSNVAMAESLEILRAGQLTPTAKAQILVGTITGLTAVAVVLIKVLWGAS